MLRMHHMCCLYELFLVMKFLFAKDVFDKECFPLSLFILAAQVALAMSTLNDNVVGLDGVVALDATPQRQRKSLNRVH